MVKGLWNVLKNAFPKKGEERSVVVEELTHGVECTEAKVNRGEKYVELISRSSVPALLDITKGRTIPNCDRLVLAVSSRRATTVEGEIRMKRSRGEGAIDEGELDAILFRALWEFLNRYRAWAAKKMGANELDLVLANVEIMDVRLGTHHVFNPLGFSGKEFTVRLKGTFIPRDLLPLLEKMRNKTRELVVVEHGSTLSNAVAGPNDFMVYVEHGATTVFASKEDERAFAGEYGWGTSSIAKALMGHLAVDEVVAEWILHQYKKNKLSERFKRLVEKHTREEFEKLIKLLTPLHAKSKHVRSTTHFHFRMDLPLLDSWFMEPHSHLAGYHEQLKLQGVHLSLSKKIRSFSPLFNQTLLALLLHPHTYIQYSFLNQLLKRRAKWLIPSK